MNKKMLNIALSAVLMMVFAILVFHEKIDAHIFNTGNATKVWVLPDSYKLLVEKPIEFRKAYYFELDEKDTLEVFSFDVSENNGIKVEAKLNYCFVRNDDAIKLLCRHFNCSGDEIINDFVMPLIRVQFLREILASRSLGLSNKESQEKIVENVFNNSKAFLEEFGVRIISLEAKFI